MQSDSLCGGGTTAQSLSDMAAFPPLLPELFQVTEADRESASMLVITAPSSPPPPRSSGGTTVPFATHDGGGARNRKSNGWQDDGGSAGGMKTNGWQDDGDGVGGSGARRASDSLPTVRADTFAAWRAGDGRKGLVGQACTGLILDASQAAGGSTVVPLSAAGSAAPSATTAAQRVPYMPIDLSAHMHQLQDDVDIPATLASIYLPRDAVGRVVCVQQVLRAAAAAAATAAPAAAHADCDWQPLDGVCVLVRDGTSVGLVACTRGTADVPASGTADVPAGGTHGGEALGILHRDDQHGSGGLAGRSGQPDEQTRRASSSKIATADALAPAFGKLRARIVKSVCESPSDNGPLSDGCSTETAWWFHLADLTRVPLNQLSSCSWDRLSTAQQVYIACELDGQIRRGRHPPITRAAVARAKLEAARHLQCLPSIACLLDLGLVPSALQQAPEAEAHRRAMWDVLSVSDAALQAVLQEVLHDVRPACSPSTQADREVAWRSLTGRKLAAAPPPPVVGGEQRVTRRTYRDKSAKRDRSHSRSPDDTARVEDNRPTSLLGISDARRPTGVPTCRDASPSCKRRSLTPRDANRRDRSPRRVPVEEGQGPHRVGKDRDGKGKAEGGDSAHHRSVLASERDSTAVEAVSTCSTSRRRKAASSILAGRALHYPELGVHQFDWSASDCDLSRAKDTYMLQLLSYMHQRCHDAARRPEQHFSDSELAPLPTELRGEFGDIADFVDKEMCWGVGSLRQGDKTLFCLSHGGWALSVHRRFKLPAPSDAEIDMFVEAAAPEDRDLKCYEAALCRFLLRNNGYAACSKVEQHCPMPDAVWRLYDGSHQLNGLARYYSKSRLVSHSYTCSEFGLQSSRYSCRRSNVWLQLLPTYAAYIRGEDPHGGTLPSRPSKKGRKSPVPVLQPRRPASPARHKPPGQSPRDVHPRRDTALDQRDALPAGARDVHPRWDVQQYNPRDGQRDGGRGRHPRWDSKRDGHRNGQHDGRAIPPHGRPQEDSPNGRDHDHGRYDGQHEGRCEAWQVPSSAHVHQAPPAAMGHLQHQGSWGALPPRTTAPNGRVTDIPCTYFNTASKLGCWKGNQCSFLHQ